VLRTRPGRDLLHHRGRAGCPGPRGRPGGVMTAAPAAVRDRRFPTLNAVRAIGALMVLLTHVAFNTGQVVRGSFGAVLSRFDFGVALFFVLSGFLLARPFLLAVARAEQGPRVAHYLWKRALRILP